MPRHKEFSENEFLKAIKESASLQEAATKLGYGRMSHHPLTLFRKMLDKLKPNTSHFNLLSRSGFNSSNKEDCVIESYFNDYKRDSNRRGRNYEFKLTLEEFENLIKDKCYYCGNRGDSTVSSKKISNKYCGIDRKNNSKGYTIENSVTCCKTCNRMKMQLNDDFFLSKIKEIYENCNLRNINVN